MYATESPELDPTKAHSLRRVLQRLKAGAVLLQTDFETYSVLSISQVTNKPIMEIDEKIFQRLVKQDLLETSKEIDPQFGKPVFRLSDVGLMYLRRLETPSSAPFGAQHRQEETRFVANKEHANTRFRVNSGESPLGWFKTRRGADGKALISDEQFEAGEKLRCDYTLAKLSTRISMNWANLADGIKQNRVGGEDVIDLTDAVIAARNRVYEALNAVGPSLSDILLQTCCYLNGLEQTEKDLGWPRRSGKLVLQIALERLAEHYQISRDP